ncbi:hypothetical protein K1M91_20390 [Motilimonas sp. E26]|nr:hypothetical protein [Motilimonas sp. E26]
MTDQQGNTVWSVHYRAYGNVLKQEIEQVHSPLRFQGQYYDAETGLHYNRHRYYNPNTAAFLTLDPIGLAGGLNNYQYVPNPTGWIDPLGLAVRKGDGDCCGSSKNAIERLNNEGHAPIRHGGPNRVTDQQLIDRAVNGIDPASGTTKDAFNKHADGTPKDHRVGKNATAFTSDDALVQADKAARESQQFKLNVLEAREQGAIFVKPVVLELKSIFGDDYKAKVRGVTRTGPKKSPTGHEVIDFTDGAVKSIYRLDDEGNPMLHTQYPEPK